MTVYSSYTYNEGGYGDFIRSLLAVFVYCKENNIEHKLYIPTHPMKECFECITNELNYPIKSYIDCNNNFLVNKLNKCKDSNYSVIIRSNKFDFISFDLLKKYTCEFKKFIKLSDSVKQRIIHLNNQINNVEYVSIHIRCGDKFMECNSQCIYNDVRINPSQNILFKKLEATIDHLKTNYNLPICIFTDVKSLKDKICSQYKLIGFNTEIHHTASTSNKEAAFIDSVAEFELLGKSKVIVKFTNTGFAFWSAFINDVPLYICNDNNEIIPFINLKY